MRPPGSSLEAKTFSVIKHLALTNFFVQNTYTHFHHLKIPKSAHRRYQKPASEWASSSATREIRNRAARVKNG